MIKFINSLLASLQLLFGVTSTFPAQSIPLASPQQSSASAIVNTYSPIPVVSLMPSVSPKPKIIDKNKLYQKIIVEYVEQWCNLDVGKPARYTSKTLWEFPMKQFGVKSDELNTYNRMVWTDQKYKVQLDEIRATQNKFCTIKRSIPPMFTYGEGY